MTKRPKNKNGIPRTPATKKAADFIQSPPLELKDDSSFWKTNWWKALILLVLSICLYYQCTNFGYVLDDQIVITDNSFTKKGFSGIGELFSTESMTGYFGEQKNLVQGNRYRPLSLVTFAIEIGVLGEMSPKVSHWINILLYGFTAILLFRLLSLLFKNHKQTNASAGWFAYGVGLLFLVHPIHVEAIANIKGRDEIMALLFSLATLFYAYKYVFNKKALYLIGANILYFLGLLSKENTITFLAVIPLTIYFFSAKSLLQSLKSVLPYFLTTLIYLFLRFSVSGIPQLGAASSDLMNNPFVDMTGGEKFATILYTLLLYIKLLFIPFPLTHDYYPYAIPKMSFADWQVWLSLIVYIAMIWWAFIKLKSKDISSFAILFYLTTLTIMSNILINLGTFMNDRFVYISSVGFCIIFVWGILKIKEKIGKNGMPVALGLFSVYALGFAYISFDRVPDWESALTLNQSAIKVSKNSARANSFMSTALFEKGRATEDAKERYALMAEGLPYAKKAIELYPTYYNGHLMYAGTASELYKIDNKIDPLLDAFEQVMIIRPDVSYITEFLTYVNNRNTENEKLNILYKKVGQTLIAKNKANDAKWAVHYLLMAYANDQNDKQTNLLLAHGYQLLGDTDKATKFMNAAQSLQ